MTKRLSGATRQAKQLDKIKEVIMTNPINRKLNRIRSQGKVAGVCAGIAEYTGLETWLVRVIWFSGLLFSGFLFIIVYIAAWFILDVKEEQGYSSNVKRGGKDQWSRFGVRDEVELARDEIDRAVHIKRNVYQSGEPPRMAFRDITQQFRGIEDRIKDMESYVTSNEFTLKREINRL
jgi:phage shock protein C